MVAVGLCLTKEFVGSMSTDGDSVGEGMYRWVGEHREEKVVEVTELDQMVDEDV